MLWFLWCWCVPCALLASQRALLVRWKLTQGVKRAGSLVAVVRYRSRAALLVLARLVCVSLGCAVAVAVAAFAVALVWICDGAASGALLEGVRQSMGSCPQACGLRGPALLCLHTRVASPCPKGVVTWVRLGGVWNQLYPVMLGSEQREHVSIHVTSAKSSRKYNTKFQ